MPPVLSSDIYDKCLIINSIWTANLATAFTFLVGNLGGRLPCHLAKESDNGMQIRPTVAGVTPKGLNKCPTKDVDTEFNSGGKLLHEL